MGWQYKDQTQPDSFELWRPFFLAAREARLEGVPWTLDCLDFRIVGRLTRKGKSTIWVYEHVPTGGELNVDDDGATYAIKLDRANRVRTKEIDIRSAVWRAGVPEYELEQEPRHHASHPGWEECAECEAWLDRDDRPPLRRKPREPAQREAASGDPFVERPADGRHLRLVK